MEQGSGAPQLVAGDRYELNAEVGRGAMAIVYDGFDRRLSRPVAVKLLRPEVAARDDVRRRFEIEARAAAQLTDPNVVAIYDTGECDGVPCLVMERLPGTTLRDRIGGEPADPEWVRQIVLDVLHALGTAHGRGILHRDLKPSNVLLTEDGRAKVADFGIAKSVDMDSEDLTLTGQIVGTPAYVAPERFAGAAATPQSDIYSVGVLMYEALTGRKPFTGATPIAVAMAARHETPVPLRELRPDLDATMVDVVERAMAKEPASRFASAAVIASALTSETMAAPFADDATLAIVPGDDTSAFASTTPADGATVAAAAMPAADATVTADPTVAAVPADAVPAVRTVGRRQGNAAKAVAVLAGLGALIALVVAAALGGLFGGSDKQTSGADLVTNLREIATRVEVGDGPKGPEAAGRLRGIADALQRGDASAAAVDAASLQRDVETWRSDRTLFRTASGLVLDVLGQVPGVDGAATRLGASPPTVAVVQPTAPVTVATRVRRGKAKKDGAEGGD